MKFDAFLVLGGEIIRHDTHATESIPAGDITDCREVLARLRTSDVEALPYPGVTELVLRLGMPDDLVGVMTTEVPDPTRFVSRVTQGGNYFGFYLPDRSPHPFMMCQVIRSLAPYKLGRGRKAFAVDPRREEIAATVKAEQERLRFLFALSGIMTQGEMVPDETAESTLLDVLTHPYSVVTTFVMAHGEPETMSVYADLAQKYLISFGAAILEEERSTATE